MDEAGEGPEDDEQLCDSFLLPLGYQVQMNLMVGGNLGNSFGFLNRFQDNLGLESSRVLFSVLCYRRWYSPYSSPFCCPNLWDHHTSLPDSFFTVWII